jgi:hypothetical protein
VKIDVFHNSDLIDAEYSIVPGIGNLVGISVAAKIVGVIESDDGGFDGERLSVLAIRLCETDCEPGVAGGIHVVGDDFAEKSIATMEFDSIVEMNVVAERGAKLVTGVDAFGIQRVQEGSACWNHVCGFTDAAWLAAL